MRPVFGLTESDRAILRLLRDAQLALKPGAVHYNLRERYNTEISDTTVHRRLPRLTYAKLVVQEDSKAGRYAITELGERLLDEELNDEEVMRVSQRLQEGPPDDED